MKDIYENWRKFHSQKETNVLLLRLEEALTRRQFLSGGAAVAILAAVIGSNYFKNLSDKEQDEILDKPTQELVSLDLSDPDYRKAVEEYYAEGGEFFHPTNQRHDLAGMSESELKTHMRLAMNELMIAPAQLPDGRPWRVAPVFQSQTTGFYAFVSEADLMAMEESYPGFSNKIQDADRFFQSMPLTALWKYTFGQQAFFSYTSAEDANAGKLFATVEVNQTITNPLTGEKEKIKVRKLPIAWTVANRVLLDRVTILEAELSDPELTREQFEAILEKHGVTKSYGQGYKSTPPEQVAQKLIQVTKDTLKSMQNANPVVGKHSNEDEVYITKETLEV